MRDWKSSSTPPLVESQSDPPAADRRLQALMHRRMLQRKARNQAVSADAGAAVEKAETSGGEPLPAPLKRSFEQSLGADLSGVRVHSGSESAEANQAMGARAYASGDHIHFGAGEYQPSTGGGRELLAHEVVHAVQQSRRGAGLQCKAQAGGGDAQEQEADDKAQEMTHSAAVKHDLVKEIDVVAGEIEIESNKAAAGEASFELNHRLIYVERLIGQLEPSQHRPVAHALDRMSAAVAQTHNEAFVARANEIRRLVGLPPAEHLAKPGKPEAGSPKQALGATLELVRDRAREITQKIKPGSDEEQGPVAHLNQDLTEVSHILKEAEKNGEDVDSLKEATKKLALQALAELRKIQRRSSDGDLRLGVAELRDAYGVADANDREVLHERDVEQQAETHDERLAQERETRRQPQGREFFWGPDGDKHYQEEQEAYHEFDKIEEDADPKQEIPNALSSVAQAMEGAFRAAQLKLAKLADVAGITDEEKKNPPGFFESLLETVASAALQEGMGDLIGGLVTKGLEEGLLKDAVSGWVSGVWNGFTENVGERLKGEGGAQENKYARIEFFESQAQALNETNTKQAVNLFAMLGPQLQQDPDPFAVIQRLRSLYIDIATQTDAMADRQYQVSLAKWCTYLAQAGTGGDGKSDTDMTKTGSLGERFVVDSVNQPTHKPPNGILIVHGKYMSDMDKKVWLVGGQIHGLNEELRKELGKQQMREIGIPMLIEVGTLLEDGKFLIRINESRQITAEADTVGETRLREIGREYGLGDHASLDDIAAELFSQEMSRLRPGQEFELKG
jgi:hypothetical protein